MGAVRSQTSANGVSSSSSFTINYPATVSAGDTLLLLLATDSSDNITLDSAWDIALITNLLHSVATANVYCAKASGSEGGGSTSATVAAGDEEFAYATFSLSGLADPDVTAPEVGSAIGTSTTPDPPSKAHSNGSDKYFVCASWLGDSSAATTTSAFPLGYSETGFELNTGQAHVAWGFKSIAGTDTEDPAPFTIDQSEEWRGATILFLSSGSALPFMMHMS